MRSFYRALTFGTCLCLAAFLAPIIDTGRPMPWQSSAVAADDAEKQAFEEAKSLGTVEAWDAFLSHYPTGFHADLARAHVKKLTEDTPAPSPQPAAPTVSANDDFPVAAGSWGGVLRDGPGQNYRQIGSLQEGEPVTLMGRSDVIENGFPWFKMTTQSGKTGYQWGAHSLFDRSRAAGPLQDLHGQAGKPERDQEAEQERLQKEEAVPLGPISQSERRLPA